MIELYKITHNEESLNRSTIRRNSQLRTRGHSMKLRGDRCNRNIRLHHLNQRTTNSWNNLTEHVISAPSLHAFENRLDKPWANHLMKHNYVHEAHDLRRLWHIHDLRRLQHKDDLWWQHIHDLRRLWHIHDLRWLQHNDLWWQHIHDLRWLWHIHDLRRLQHKDDLWWQHIHDLRWLWHIHDLRRLQHYTWLTWKATVTYNIHDLWWQHCMT